MEFRDLGIDEELLHALSDAGYTVPTPIQEQAIPALFIDKKAAEGTLPFFKGIIINLKPIAQGAELMVPVHIKSGPFCVCHLIFSLYRRTTYINCQQYKHRQQHFGDFP